MSPAVGAETPGAVIEVPREVTVSRDLYVRQTSGLVRTVGPGTALLANLVGMGIIVNFFWVVFASVTYPHADLTSTVGIAVLVNLGVAFVYWMLSTAMPRSGGDYVYVSRIFHPSLGFAVNLTFTIIFVSWSGLFPYYLALYGLPMMFAAYGVVGHNATALSWASTISGSVPDQFLIGAIVLIAVILISLLPTRWIFRTAVGIFVLSAIIFVIMMALLFSTPQSSFAAHWNAYSGNPTYSSVISSYLSANGLSRSDIAVSSAGTFVGIVYTMLSFIGYANTAYFGSEVRGSPLRTQGIAIFGAPLIFAALIALLYAGTYFTFGHDFLVALSGPCTGSTLGSCPTPAGGFPSPLFLVSYILGNPVLAGFLAFGVTLTFFGFALVYFIIPTRNLFAWSFDRIMPAGLARVSRNGVPYVAVLTLAVLAFVSLYLTAYTKIFTFLAYSNFGFWFVAGIVCLGAALFPFLKRSWFEAAPSIVRAKVGPVPVLTIVGVLAWGGSWFVSYSSTLPAVFGLAYNYTELFSMIAVFIAGLVIYGVVYGVQRARGIPLDLVNKELPPE
jgi:APA family basic amino acid/polyamine antiporter